MKKLFIPGIGIIMLLLFISGCITTRSTCTISGKVVIQGAVPDRIIQVCYIINNSAANIISTDSNGNYSFLVNFRSTEHLWINVDSSDVYSASEITTKGLNLYNGISNFYMKEGNINVPDIDLYNYGFVFTAPADMSTINDIEVFLQASEYNKTLHSTNSPQYDLYFYDLAGNYLGQFNGLSTGPNIYFDGEMIDAYGHIVTLAQSALWFLRCIYPYDVNVHSGEYYKMYATAPYHTIFYSNSAQSITSLKSAEDHEDAGQKAFRKRMFINPEIKD